MTMGEFSEIMLCLTFMLPDNSCSGALVGGIQDPYNGIIHDLFPGAMCLALLSDQKCTVAGSLLLSNTNEPSLSAYKELPGLCQ